MNEIIIKVLVILQMVVSWVTGVQAPVEIPLDMQSLIEEVEGIGTATFDPRAGGVYRLKSGITSSQSTLPLVSFKFPVSDNEITLPSGEIGYGTVEPGSATNKEFISYTGITQNSDGSATLTGLTRGLDFQTSDETASTTLQKAHSGGSQFILSDSPQFFTQFWRLNTNATSTAILSFSSTTVPRYDENPIWANVASTTLTTKGYADDLAIAGAPDASQTVKGIVETATQLEVASSTSAGGTTANLFIRNIYSTTTPDLSAGNRPNNYIPVSNSDGKLDLTWLDLTEDWGFATSTIFKGGSFGIEQQGTKHPFVVGDTGTSTPHFWITAKGDVRLATTTQSDKWQLAVQGTTTTNGFQMSLNRGDYKVLTSNSNGAGTWEYAPVAFSFASSTATTIGTSSGTTTRFRAVIPSGMFGANSAIKIDIGGSSSGENSTQYPIVGIRAGAGGSAVFNTRFLTNLQNCATGHGISVTIANRNATNSQVLYGTGVSGGGSCSGVIGLERRTAALTTAGSDVHVEVSTINNASGGTWTLDSVVVTLIP